ncbi:MAG: Mu transposase C-terminal domain-containing protein [Marinobacter sp.]|uniref:Mu transposase C-terminal domain-containing protein n=1 Tax=Marinobacter sp. TaxID=50741 RepID=UPI00299CF00A|nr:Mu transposase C-terminal domain-containing protein [Marinobacter sp.]MDX1755855.1 Mu transposase C-terminal domain-containing protein [Marinobacter sp.]
MKQWLTAKELAAAKLQGLPHSEKGMIEKAKRESWEAQQRMGRGGGFEYHINNLPLEARKALEAQQAAELLTRVAEAPKQLAPATKALASQPLTEKQRATADARVTIINAIELLRNQGVTQQAAMVTMLTHAEVGELAVTNPVLDKALRMAKDSRGRGNGSPYPSVRSLKRYLAKDVKALAPQKRQPEPPPAWVNAFLVCWQRPEKPSIAHAYRDMVERWASPEQPPSIYAVRRFLDKIGNVSKQHGRMGPRELKNLMPFVRRDFSDMMPAEVYSADGHTFDGEVQHPLHGRPFRPEITSWIDIATRRVVGVSVALAESSIAVLDALIDSCTKAIPAIAYVDNGSGYCNALLKDEATGVLARLGTTMSHSLPYNSQARGVIERVHQTLWVDGAKQLPGYVGMDMDREARHQQFKISRKALKGGAQTLMAWDTFMDWVHQRVAWYNERPHSSLPKVTDVTGTRRHATPNEQWQTAEAQGWQALTLTGDEAAQVFRPRVTRTVNRCEINLFKNLYFSKDLEEFHGEQVQVAYDLNDANTIWVFDQEHDRLICRAEWNANRVDYFPKSVREQAIETRAKARLKRNDAQREEIEAELRGQPLLEHDNSMSLGALGTVNGELIRRQAQQRVEVEPDITPLSRFEQMTRDERYRLFCQYESGQLALPEADRGWFKSYPMSAEYRSMKRREEESEEWGSTAAIR